MVRDSEAECEACGNVISDIAKMAKIGPAGG